MKNSFWINNRRLKLLAADVLTVRERAFLGLAVVLLLMLSWSGFTAFMHRPFSFLNIFFIHHYFPVWIVDFFILAFPVIILILKNFLRNYIAGVKKSLNENIERYERNIHLAKALKENNLGTIEPNGDVLSETLLDLGKSIRISKKREEEHNWITRGKDQISDILRNAHNMDDLSFNTLKTIIDYMGGVQGAFYILNDNVLKRAAMYAYGRRRFEYHEIAIGKGLIGAAAFEKAMIYRTEIPDDYYTITSGLLGEQKPKSIVILPLLQEENLQGVMEIAFLASSVPALKLHFASEVSSIIGQTIYNLRITTRTQHLLKESQEMTAALRENEEKLRENAQEMIAAQEELEKSNKLLETQIQEVANSRKRLEALLTNASEFISIYNEKQELVFESPSVKRILGYNDDDKISGIDPEILTPRGLRTINNLFQFAERIFFVY